MNDINIDILKPLSQGYNHFVNTGPLYLEVED
jgi:hypothetical protein